MLDATVVASDRQKATLTPPQSVCGVAVKWVQDERRAHARGSEVSGASIEAPESKRSVSKSGLRHILGVRALNRHSGARRASCGSFGTGSFSEGRKAKGPRTNIPRAFQFVRTMLDLFPSYDLLNRS